MTKENQPTGVPGQRSHFLQDLSPLDFAYTAENLSDPLPADTRWIVNYEITLAMEEVNKALVLV